MRRGRRGAYKGHAHVFRCRRVHGLRGVLLELMGRHEAHGHAPELGLEMTEVRGGEGAW